MQRLADWFLGLGVGGKVFATLVGMLAAFTLMFILIFGVGLTWRLSQGEEVRMPGSGGEPEADRSQAEITARESMEERTEEGSEERPGADVMVGRAEWEGGGVVAEGSWTGRMSSVRCDLFEGEEDSDDLQFVGWWDRSVPAEYDRRGRTFTQAFAPAAGESIAPDAEYEVLCWGIFQNLRITSELAPVEGEPPTAG